MCTRCNLTWISLSVIFCKCVISSGIPVSSANKTDRHDITKILLKARLNTHNANLFLSSEINFAINYRHLYPLSFFDYPHPLEVGLLLFGSWDCFEPGRNCCPIWTRQEDSMLYWYLIILFYFLSFKKKYIYAYTCSIIIFVTEYDENVNIKFSAHYAFLE